MVNPNMLDKIRLHEEAIFSFSFAAKFTTREGGRVMNSEEMQAHF
jgi:hypothetical protein